LVEFFIVALVTDKMTFPVVTTPKRLVREMQAISLQERGKEANKNLLEGKVQRGSAVDLMDVIFNNKRVDSS